MTKTKLAQAIESKEFAKTAEKIMASNAELTKISVERNKIITSAMKKFGFASYEDFEIAYVTVITKLGKNENENE